MVAIFTDQFSLACLFAFVFLLFLSLVYLFLTFQL